VIIRGNPAGSVTYWSDHLQRDDTNEKAEVKEISGLTADNLRDALWEMKCVASGSRCQGNFMYQANINPLAHEQLTPGQWKEAVDTLEKNLGLEGHQRVVVEHVKEGRQHYHVIWNRVDVDTMRVADMGGNYRTHTRTQEELEQRFGLTPTPERTPDKARPLELWEMRAAERSGLHPSEIKAELTALWRSSDSGPAFAAAIEAHGYTLARGDRRDFCIVDCAGDAHSLARRLDGVKAAEVRAFMAEIDRDKLPSVAEARAEQRERAAAQSREAADRPRPGADQAPRPAEAAAPPQAQERGEAKPSPAAAPARAEQKHQAKEADRPRSGGSERGELPSPARPWASPSREDVRSAPFVPAPAAPARDAAQGGLMVMNAITGVGDKLVDVVGDLLFGAATPAPPPDMVQAILEQRRAAAALENIRDSIEANRPLQADDVRNLTPRHLMEIREKGDDYIRQLIRGIEDDRERDREWGRERER
jgi:hypothetical protein